MDGKHLYERLFPLAEEMGASPADERQGKIRATITPYVESAQASTGMSIGAAR